VSPTAYLDGLEKRKFFTLPGLDLRPLCRQAVASLYTDYVIPGSQAKKEKKKAHKHTLEKTRQRVSSTQ
jgi:hypothetical protein